MCDVTWEPIGDVIARLVDGLARPGAAPALIDMTAAPAGASGNPDVRTVRVASFARHSAVAGEGIVRGGGALARSDRFPRLTSHELVADALRDAGCATSEHGTGRRRSPKTSPLTGIDADRMGPGGIEHPVGALDRRGIPGRLVLIVSGEFGKRPDYRSSPASWHYGVTDTPSRGRIIPDGVPGGDRPPATARLSQQTGS